MESTSFHILLRRLARNRSLRVTPEGTRFLLFTLAVGVAAINTGNNLFYLLLAMMLSLVVLSGMLSEQCLRRLEFRRHLPEVIFANQPATVSLSVANRKPRLPSFSLCVRDVAGGRDVEPGVSIRHLAPQQSLLISYRVFAARRGRLPLEGIRVATPFPFGLFLKQALYPLQDDVLVCPEIVPLPAEILEYLAGEGQDRSLARRGHGVELYNLRLYRPGDDSRAIHWMTTARTAQLIVRETAAEDQRRVTIVVSTVAPEHWDEVFERGLSIAASLVQHFHERGYLVRLLAGDIEREYGTGEEHLLDMLKALALCRRRPPDAHGLGGLPTPHQRQEGLTVAVVPWRGRGSASIGADCMIDERMLMGGRDGTRSSIST